MSRATGNPSRRVDALRKRGVRGGRIAPHRAMIGLEVSRWLLVDLLVLPAIFATAMILVLDYLLDGWRIAFAWMQQPLGLGAVDVRITELVPSFFVSVPYFTSDAHWPTSAEMLGGWITVVLLAVAGVLMRGRATPRVPSTSRGPDCRSMSRIRPVRSRSRARERHR